MIPYGALPMKPTPKQKILVILGPTASGKTSLAVALAQTFSGEVISSDSRQVYRGLDIGTEKITEEEMADIPHHLIDCVDPETIYTAFDFKKDAAMQSEAIASRGHLPIIAGGTLFYTETLLGRRNTAQVPPNSELRAELEKLSTEVLFNKLQEIDPRRAEAIDAHNPRRLVRALEIAHALGAVPEEAIAECPYDAYIIGLSVSADILKERITLRLKETLAKGLVEETQMLLKKGVPEERLMEIGLEYRVVLEHLKGDIPADLLEQKLIDKVWQYAKRQRTWLKRINDVHWYDPTDRKIFDDVKYFLNKE